MILADTSVWVDHFRRPIEAMIDLLERERIVMHPFVYGEIALGSFAQRSKTLALLRDLHPLAPATHAEAIALIEWHGLHGTGLSYVDVHLLAAVRAADPQIAAKLWTRDRRLNEKALEFGIAVTPE